jgi:spore coat polysaccharide biosynthesis protein SpsF
MFTVASVQARLGSTRLPGKVLYHLGDRRILQWPIDRAQNAKTIDKTVAAIGDQPENDAIEAYCERAEVDFLTGSEDNLLARHRAVAKRTDCDLLVRITADCPFVPSSEIDRVVERHLSNDARYTTNNTDEMPTGIAVDVIDPDLLAEFESLGATHPVDLPHSNPDQWRTAWTEHPSWRAVSDAHIAVDTPTDYWALSDAIEEVGDEPLAVAGWVSER